MGKEAKTNAMRILERAKVAYTAHEYPHEEGVAVDGIHVAQSMGEDPACVYKTLVTQGASRNYFVFVIPVAAELDLKAAARSVGEKSVAMIHVADINKVTGYVRGGCSPVGMKKQYTTVFDEIMQVMNRSSCDSGRSCVPALPLGFCVAMTTNGCGTFRLTPSTVTLPSSITSRSADCVFGEVRLISSARNRLHMIVPGWYTNCPVSFWYMLNPTISAGSTSGVNCTR